MLVAKKYSSPFISCSAAFIAFLSYNCWVCVIVYVCIYTHAHRNEPTLDAGSKEVLESLHFMQSSFHRLFVGTLLASIHPSKLLVLKKNYQKNEIKIQYKKNLHLKEASPSQRDKEGV